MKNRRLPYGYKIIEGNIVINPEEEKIIKKVFNLYIEGANLNEISISLTAEKVEYLPGECNWNKSRIKRMIEDVRYLGNETYDAIIDIDIFNKANAEKSSRRLQDKYLINENNKYLVKNAICGECGEKLIHKTDRRQKNEEIWYCKNIECRHNIPMSINELENEIVKILNRLIENPELCEMGNEEAPVEFSENIIKYENKINLNTNSPMCDKSEVQKMILECASLRYDEINSIAHITAKLKADLKKSDPLLKYSADLFERTVSKVILSRNTPVLLKLKNGKIIGKEV